MNARIKVRVIEEGEGETRSSLWIPMMQPIMGARAPYKPLGSYGPSKGPSMTREK